MSERYSRRLCLDPHDISRLRREGQAWGFDLDGGCGCIDTPVKDRNGMLRTLKRLLKGT